jgi:hypothetical protein
MQRSAVSRVSDHESPQFNAALIFFALALLVLTALVVDGGANSFSHA